MSIGYGLIGSAVKVDPKNGRRCRVADGWLMIGELNIVMILGDISRFVWIDHARSMGQYLDLQILPAGTVQ